MATYVFRNLEYHNVTTEKFEEFDTSDQKHWAELLERARSNEIDTDDCPDEAPSEPEEWFALLSQLPGEELLSQQDDDWTSMSKGGFDTALILEDANGAEIMRED